MHPAVPRFGDLAVRTSGHEPLEELASCRDRRFVRRRGGRVEHRAGPAEPTREDQSEHRHVVGVVRVESIENIEAETPGELCVDPPHRTARRTQRHDCGGERTPVAQGDVGPFELMIHRNHVGRDRCDLVGPDVEHGENVELAQGSQGPVRIGQRGQGICTGHEQRSQVPCLDLIDQSRHGIFAHEARQVGPARRSGNDATARRCRVPFGALVEWRDQAPSEPHSSRAIEGPRHDEQSPEQPHRRDGMRTKRRTGSHQPRYLAGLAHCGQQRRQVCGGHSGPGRDAIGREWLECLTQSFHVEQVGVGGQLLGVGAVVEELSHEPGQDGSVTARKRGEVMVGELRCLGSTRVEYAKPATALTKLADPSHRVAQEAEIPM
jgi:hypothetical protein